MTNDTLFISIVIVESIPHNTDWYAFPSEIFVPTCETVHAGYWLGRDGQQDYFILDLLTNDMIHKVRLKNTHNTSSRDRATNFFKVDISNDTVTWINAVDSFLVNTLNPPLTCEDIPIQTYAIEKVAKFLRFKIISGYILNGGLNFIEVI